jgi:hypothetical protein
MHDACHEVREKQIPLLYDECSPGKFMITSARKLVREPLQNTLEVETLRFVAT